MITKAAIRAPSDTPGSSRKLCQSQYSRAADKIRLFWRVYKLAAPGVDPVVACYGSRSAGSHFYV